MYEVTEIFAGRGSVCTRCSANRSQGEEHTADCPHSRLHPIPETPEQRHARRMAILAQNAKILAFRAGTYS